jgi:hypothetical protein
LHQQWLCFGCVCGASTSGFQNMKPQSYDWIANHVHKTLQLLQGWISGLKWTTMLQVCFQSMITDVCAYKCFTFVGTMEGVSGVTKLSEYLSLLDDGWRWWLACQQHHPCCICTWTKLRGREGKLQER